MTRVWGKIVAVLGAASFVIATGGSALAQGKAKPKAEAGGYDQLAADATVIASPTQLAAILWPHRTSCEGGTDFTRRQCEQMRAARAEAVGKKVYRIQGNAQVFQIGDYDDKKKSVPLSVRACVACAGPVDVDGAPTYVVGAGPRKVEGDAIVAPVVKEGARTFASKAEAETWKTEVAPRLRSEMLFKVPVVSKPWTAGKQGGVEVQIVGFRVHDPCDGSLVQGSHAGAGPIDASTCAEKEEEPEPAAVAEPEPAKPVVPAVLSSQQIKSALRPAQAEAQKCFQTFGVAGDAMVQITFDASGKITALEQKGDFVDTPTGTCIEKVVRAITFPASRKAETTVTYPIMLR